MADRREFLGSASLTLAAGVPALAGAAQTAPPSPAMPAGIRVPKCELVYECDATLLPAIEMGKTVEGQRRIIPITGGTVQGPRIRGELLSGGYDWNLSRSDGAGSVEAAYYIKTDDGVLIRIVNVGVSAGGPPPPVDEKASELFFMFTHPSFEAPVGKYDWMNRAMFVGTLGARKNARNAVLIRVFQLV
jgi:hypothetical protein